MWVQLIEKAYAKLHGCYGNLISGYIDEGVQELTGCQPLKMPIRDEETGEFPHKSLKVNGKRWDEDYYWLFLKNMKATGSLLGCSIKAKNAGQFILDSKPTGLIQNHAYAILDIVEVRDLEAPDKTRRLLLIRNPWANSEWNGAWSSNSKETIKYRAVLEAINQSRDEEERIKPDAEDGVFYMEYDDWNDCFTQLFINMDYPDSWTGVRF